MLSGLEQRGRMDLGCGRGQGKKQHGMAHLQNPRSRSDQRRQGDTVPCRWPGNSWCSPRALSSDVDPLRYREMAARAFFQRLAKTESPCNAQDMLSLGRQLEFGLEQLQKEVV